MSEDTQKKLDALVEYLRRSQAGASVEVPVTTNGHVVEGEVADDAVIEKCRAAGNAEKFADLYDHGDVEAHHGGDD